MTINERVSPKRLAEIIARAEVCDDSVLTDYRDIESIARELQQYRAAAGSRALFTCSACGAEGLDEPLESKCHCCIDGAHWIESRLYAAPQVTSVPDEKPDWMHNEFSAGWNSCRAAMLAAPAEQAEQLSGNTEQAIGDAFISEFERLIHERDSEIDAGQLGSYNYTALLKAASDAFATVTGNSPAIPDGYALVPVELTPDMRAAWDSAPNTDDDDHNMQAAYRAMVAAAPKQEAE